MCFAKLGSRSNNLAKLGSRSKPREQTLTNLAPLTANPGKPITATATAVENFMSTNYSTPNEMKLKQLW
jgi:hypothetical protein